MLHTQTEKQKNPKTKTPLKRGAGNKANQNPNAVKLWATQHHENGAKSKVISSLSLPAAGSSRRELKSPRWISF